MRAREDRRERGGWVRHGGCEASHSGVQCSAKAVKTMQGHATHCETLESTARHCKVRHCKTLRDHARARQTPQENPRNPTTRYAMCEMLDAGCRHRVRGDAELFHPLEELHPVVDHRVAVLERRLRARAEQTVERHHVRDQPVPLHLPQDLHRFLQPAVVAVARGLDASVEQRRERDHVGLHAIRRHPLHHPPPMLHNRPRPSAPRGDGARAQKRVVGQHIWLDALGLHRFEHAEPALRAVDPPCARLVCDRVHQCVEAHEVRSDPLLLHLLQHFLRSLIRTCFRHQLQHHV
eukprot:3188992-Rhodomonas_salina.1